MGISHKSFKVCAALFYGGKSWGSITNHLHIELCHDDESLRWNKLETETKKL